MIMKKTYIKPITFEVSLCTEGMIALSISGRTDEVWTNKKESTAFDWETSSEEDESYFESKW
jgi:hypothetical protein